MAVEVEVGVVVPMGRSPQPFPASPPARSVDIAVVGGGALGCSAALALAEDGHTVDLWERKGLGGGSTAKAAGILSSFAWNDADYRLIAETRGLIGEAISLALAAGERAARGAWRPAPSLVVARGQEGMRLLDQLQDRVERMTEECERMDATRAAREFPAVSFEAGEECLVAQEDGVIEAGDLLVALRQRMGDAGVTLHEGHERPLLGSLPADRVVVAGGAWTKPWLSAQGVPLPALAYRTQLANLLMPGAAEVPIVHDLHHHFYARPESDASFLAGDGTQLRPFDPSDYDEAADPGFVHSIAERVVARFTDGHAARLRAGWAGLCVGTPDRRPLVGAIPGRGDVFVLTGDNGFGLMRSLALGVRLAEAVAGRGDPALEPGRFGWPPPQQFEMREGYGAP
ncbi:MAG TPA: FAD-dependent oxidoreductase [Candidatus Thermoplasmatota archaeon]|nr:FAD-dependent oxidoreductase [Candidatus Thermoplasmatota archaeon]